MSKFEGMSVVPTLYQKYKLLIQLFVNEALIGKKYVFWFRPILILYSAVRFLDFSFGSLCFSVLKEKLRFGSFFLKKFWTRLISCSKGRAKYKLTNSYYFDTFLVKKGKK